MKRGRWLRQRDAKLSRDRMSYRLSVCSVLYYGARAVLASQTEEKD